VKNNCWEQSKVTLPLRNQISEYVRNIVAGDIPSIPFDGYQSFRDNGSRKESELAYFNVRKQLTALGVYLQWVKPSDKEKAYFNELLWSVSNEFTWCLAAHLPYDKDGFGEEAARVIDLFAAETAATLSELITLHKEIIDSYISNHIRRQINHRIFEPFLKKSWGWENSRSNWCAVCAGSIGMAALLLETGDRKKEILNRVDIALLHYLNGFGEDGATEEGVGYWVYGFGYYIYYSALRQELDPEYLLPEDIKRKIIRIAEFPLFTQITEESYLPFSDAGSGTVIPSGLLSYLQQEYGINPPSCSEITSFDFDNCYRYAHISRNLWWTEDKLFGAKQEDFIRYFADKQWLIQRKGPFYVALKGGSNAEEHNHNDVGSFILALDGVLILTDLGAGAYTADYFGSRRYEDVHTRSYWHNVPLIQGKEQIPTHNSCVVRELDLNEETATITMELKGLYDIEELEAYNRSFSVDLTQGHITITDEFIGTKELEIEEGLISTIRPVISDGGSVMWCGSTGHVTLRYDTSRYIALIEEAEVNNHLGVREKIYRLGLRTLLGERNPRIDLLFSVLFTK